MTSLSSRQRRHGGRLEIAAFSLIEVTIVIVIIGLLAAIAIPRLNRGAAGASEAAFADNITVLRRAIEHYYVEHGQYPTCLPAGSDTTIMLQLTQYTDAAGNCSPTRSTAHPYGPYLRAIPPIMVGRYKDANKIMTTELPDIGWVYTPATGEIRGYSEGLLNLPSGRALATY
jgi:general secretion pathway protein G